MTTETHTQSDAGMKAASTDLRTMNFYDDVLVTFEHEGVPYVAMRRIVENMGMAWPRQHDKLLAQKEKFSCNLMVTTGADGKTYNMLCMPVDKLQLWLASVNPTKIRDDAIRAKVERYQAESAIALHDYWTKGGGAVRSDMDGIVAGIEPEVMNALGGMMKKIMHKQLASILPQLVERTLLESGHVVSTDFRPALDVLEERKVPVRGRRAFSQKVSSRLRRFSTKSTPQFPFRISRETGRYLFHVEAIKAWLCAEGDALIRDHVASILGQARLTLVGGKGASA